MDGLKNLQEAVRLAISAAGYTQKEVAAKINITEGALSMALKGKTGMREERWRMVCEMLGLDFDELMGYKEPSAPEADEEDVFAPLPEFQELEEDEAQEKKAAEKAPTEMQTPKETAAPVNPAEVNPAEEEQDVDPRLRDNLRILCAYAEGHIMEDIRRGGWDCDLDKLRGLLDAVCDLRDAVKNA